MFLETVLENGTHIEFFVGSWAFLKHKVVSDIHTKFFLHNNVNICPTNGLNLLHCNAEGGVGYQHAFHVPLVHALNRGTVKSNLLPKQSVEL